MSEINPLLLGEATLNLYREGAETTAVWFGACANGLRMAQDYQSFNVGQSGTATGRTQNLAGFHTIEILRLWGARMPDVSVVTNLVTPDVTASASRVDAEGGLDSSTWSDPGSQLVDGYLFQSGDTLVLLSTVAPASTAMRTLTWDGLPWLEASASVVPANQIVQVLNGTRAGMWRHNADGTWTSVPALTTTVTTTPLPPFRPQPNERFVLQIVWQDEQTGQIWQRTYRGVTLDGLSEDSKGVLQSDHAQRFRAETVYERQESTATPGLLSDFSEPIRLLQFQAGSNQGREVFNFSTGAVTALAGMIDPAVDSFTASPFRLTLRDKAGTIRCAMVSIFRGAAQRFAFLSSGHLPPILLGQFTNGLDGWSATPFGGGAFSAAWNPGGWLDATSTVGGASHQIRPVNAPLPGGSIAIGDKLRLRYRAKASVNGLTLTRALGQFAFPHTPVLPNTTRTLTTAWQTVDETITATAATSSPYLVLVAGNGQTGVWSIGDVFLERLGPAAGTSGPGNEVVVTAANNPVVPSKPARLEAWWSGKRLFSLTLPPSGTMELRAGGLPGEAASLHTLFSTFPVAGYDSALIGENGIVKAPLGFWPIAISLVGVTAPGGGVLRFPMTNAGQDLTRVQVFYPPDATTPEYTATAAPAATLDVPFPTTGAGELRRVVVTPLYHGNVAMDQLVEGFPSSVVTYRA